MVLVTVILFLTSIRSFQTWEITNDQFDILKSWGMTRVKRQSEILKELPNYDKKSNCDNLYKTEETPFTAFVLFKSSGRMLCMGSIVDKEHILTSKICIDRLEASDLFVVVGSFKPWWGRESQVLGVKKVVRHEYMIALLRLKKEIKFTRYIKPVRLPTSHTKAKENYEEVFASPYHLVGVPVDRYDVPGDHLRKDKLYEIKTDSYVSVEACKVNYTTLSLDKTKLFCASGNATYCWGGWGSPVLKLQHNSYYLQIGVVVNDNCSAEPVAPFLIARTDSFGDWIRGNSYQEHQPQ